MILSNITVPLDEHCLSVNVDIEILMEEATNTHPDNPIKLKEESRAVTNINWVRYILLGKYGTSIELYNAPTELLRQMEQIILNELENKSLEELKTM